MTIATALFHRLSLAAAAGCLCLEAVHPVSQESYKSTLSTREQQFNTDLISQLKGENVRIDLAKQLLRNHMALSQIFDIIVV